MPLPNPQRNGDDFRRQNKIGTNRPFNFVLFKLQRILRRQLLQTLLALRWIFFMFTRLQHMQHFLYPFKAETRHQSSTVA